jgi:hypothetical protein
LEIFSEIFLLQRNIQLAAISKKKKTNEIAPSHARVLKTKIGLASGAKPFKTTPKGSIQRQAVVKDYAEEIDAIYALSDEEYLGAIPQKASLEDIMRYIQSIVSGLLSVDHVGDERHFCHGPGLAADPSARQDAARSRSFSPT